MNAPDWSFRFSQRCATIEGVGYACMVCGLPATGHVNVHGGSNHGRCIAVVCAYHASEDGWPATRDRFSEWMVAHLMGVDGGPGDDGSPEVWHVDHLDPLPVHA